ncbi:MAG: 50S ribosomal protein L9 [Patescibacteria group bacterium]|nr:50S ribosomal protein L9 [Patescibacteria group bacterium]
MKVILLTDIPKVGNRYDVKDFKEGYAQNVLLAKGLAVLATPAELSKLKDRKAKLDKKKEEEDKLFSELISSIDNKKITIFAKANEKGHLFKAVSSRDIIDAIYKNTNINIEENSLVMDHIKEIGLHKVMIKKGDKKGECEIIVEPQK